MEAQFSRWKSSTNFSVNFTASICNFHVSGGLLEILAGVPPVQVLSKLCFQKHFSILLEAVREQAWLTDLKTSASTNDTNISKVLPPT